MFEVNIPNTNFIVFNERFNNGNKLFNEAKYEESIVEYKRALKCFDIEEVKGILNDTNNLVPTDVDEYEIPRIKKLYNVKSAIYNISIAYYKLGNNKLFEEYIYKANEIVMIINNDNLFVDKYDTGTLRIRLELAEILFNDKSYRASYLIFKWLLDKDCLDDNVKQNIYKLFKNMEGFDFK